MQSALAMTITSPWIGQGSASSHHRDLADIRGRCDGWQRGEKLGVALGPETGTELRSPEPMSRPIATWSGADNLDRSSTPFLGSRPLPLNGLSILIEVKPPTREPDGEIRLSGSEGGSRTYWVLPPPKCSISRSR